MKEFHQKLAKLITINAIEEARIKSNTKHYLVDIDKKYIKLLKVLDDIEYALSSDSVFDYWSENKSEFSNPIDIQGEALIRCNKALKILGEYRGNENKSN